MKLTVAVVRVYGTDDQYGAEPRLRPAGAPVVYSDFPELGASARMDFGPVPDDIVEAERGRRALGAVMLRGLFGGDPVKGDTPDERIETALQEASGEPLFEACNWYLTLVVTREIDVPDDQLPTGFAFPESGFPLAREEQERARQPLDLLTTLAASVVDAGVFSRLVLDDRVLLFAEGKRAAGVPEFTGSAIGNVTRGDESVAELTQRLQALRQVDPKSAAQNAWLSRIAHWRAQILLERDPWKRFLWSFIALEILTNKLYDELRDAVTKRLTLQGDTQLTAQGLPLDELLWDPRRAPVAAKFALVAMALFPVASVDDAASFRELKTARDRLSHGGLRDEAEVPAGKAVELLEKYVAGAMQQLVFAP